MTSRARTATSHTLYSYIYIKSDTWGTLNWGHLSPASDNPAVLADLSGTVIESNSVFFEGPGFFLRAKGNGGTSLAGATWGNFLTCQAWVPASARTAGARLNRRCATICRPGAASGSRPPTARTS